jgi:hypothetical protein
MAREKAADEVRRVTGCNTSLSDSHLREISRAPKHLWKGLIEATVKESWTTEELREVIQRLTPVRGGS